MNSDEQLTFPQKIVRLVAMVGLAYALISTCQIALGLAQNHFLSLRLYPFGMPLARFLPILWVGQILLLTVGAIALLRWKAWGRTCVIIWTFVMMGFSSISNFSYLV